MSAYSAVACDEVHGTMQESWSHDEGTAAVVLRCAWGVRHSLANDLLANERAWPHATVPYPPLAKTVSIVPEPGAYVQDGQSMIYTAAIVTVSYSTKERDVVSESLEPAVEFLTLDYKGFRWGSKTGDPLAEAEAPGKQLKTLSLVRTMYKLTPPLPVAMLDRVGSANDADYASALLGLTFPLDTLLYQGCSLNRRFTSGVMNEENGKFDVTVKFTYKPQGWNKFWRSKTQAWEYIYRVDAAGADPYLNYPRMDFSPLLY